MQQTTPVASSTPSSGDANESMRERCDKVVDRASERWKKFTRLPAIINIARGRTDPPSLIAVTQRGDAGKFFPPLD